MRATLPSGVLLATILAMSVPGSATALTFVEAPGSPYATTDKHFVPSSVGLLGGAVAGDFNGDGISDLAVVNATGLPAFSPGESVTILLGHPDGELTIAPGSPVEIFSGGFVSSIGSAIATGDFTNDGHLDLAVVDSINDTISILLGDGTGRFRLSGAPIPFSGEEPKDIAVGDFNGGGNEDLAFACGSSVNVLLGNGSGGFAPAPGAPFAAPGYVDSVVAGHFNADGLSDLAVTTDSGQLGIYLATGEGRFREAAGSPLAVGESAGSMVAGDFNGDGKTDLAILTSDSAVSVLLGDGSGGFVPAQGSPFAVPGGPNASPSTPGSPDSIAIGDFNGDGNMDLAMANFNGTSNDIAVLQGDEHGGFTNAVGSPFPANGNPSSLMVGDFNGDGLPDLAVVNSFLGVVTVLDNTTHEGPEGPPSPPGPISPTPPLGTSATVPTRAQILKSLTEQLGPSGSWAGLRPPVKGRGFAFPFQALEAGTARVDWYAPPPARRHARDAHTRPMLLASGRLTFSTAATKTVRIRFTKAGTLLLQRTERLWLIARGTFTPIGSTTPITAVTTVALK